jgi:hypothetical protein
MALTVRCVGSNVTALAPRHLGRWPLLAQPVAYRRRRPIEPELFGLCRIIALGDALVYPLVDLVFYPTNRPRGWRHAAWELVLAFEFIDLLTGEPDALFDLWAT